MFMLVSIKGIFDFLCVIDANILLIQQMGAKQQMKARGKAVC